MSVRLEVIQWERLRNGDTTERLRLLNICRTTGIFHLDLKGESAHDLLKDLRTVDDAQVAFFNHPLETKMKYATGVPDRGYERFSDPDVDILELSREEELSGKLLLPEELQAISSSLRNVTNTSDSILREIFSILCASLELAVSNSIAADRQRPGKSNLGLGVARASAGTPLMSSHVDDGLLTILYHITPFIEIPASVSGEWASIEMAEGLHIVNIGEAFEKLSEGRLKGATHRIIQAEGDNHLITYYLHCGLE